MPTEEEPGPKFVGMDPTPDSVVAGYAKGAKARRKARQEEARKGRPKIPNLLRANEQYDPRKEKAMTGHQIAEAQDTMDRVVRGEEKAQAKPETIRGLQQIKEYADKERARMDEEQKTEEKPDEEKAEANPPPKRVMSEETANDVIGSMDDMDLELLMERVRSDIINNEVEKKAIAEKVKPIDLTEGLATGEFKQVVPIKEGLEVTYRTVSQMENDHCRRILFNWAAEDARVASLAGERYGLMQTICAIVKINGEQMPKHLKEDGNGAYQWLEKVFLQKYALISSYPSPLIHVLGTHAYWFDQRVRELFTSKTIKNG